MYGITGCSLNWTLAVFTDSDNDKDDDDANNMITRAWSMLPANLRRSESLCAIATNGHAV